MTNSIREILMRVRDAGALDDNYGAEGWAMSDEAIDQAEQALQDYFLELVDNTSSLGASHPQFANYISANELRKAIKEGK